MRLAAVAVVALARSAFADPTSVVGIGPVGGSNPMAWGEDQWWLGGRAAIDVRWGGRRIAARAALEYEHFHLGVPDECEYVENGSLADATAGARIDLDEPGDSTHPYFAFGLGITRLGVRDVCPRAPLRSAIGLALDAAFGLDIDFAPGWSVRPELRVVDRSFSPDAMLGYAPKGCCALEVALMIAFRP